MKKCLRAVLCILLAATSFNNQGNAATATTASVKRYPFFICTIEAEMSFGGGDNPYRTKIAAVGIGDTPSIAYNNARARLWSAAGCNKVVITSTTFRR